MKELIIVRHGQTDWNRARKIMGRLPIPLNEMGQRQARGVADFLKDASIDAIFTSPVVRARQTAEIIAINHPNAAWYEAEEITEVEFGEWIGLSVDEVYENFRSQIEAYVDRPEEIAVVGGESLCQVKERVGGLIDRLAKEAVGQRVVFVSHADPIKIAIIHALGLPFSSFKSFSIDNGAVIIIRYDERLGPRLILHNPNNGFGKDM